MSLTAKQKRFVDEYFLTNMNATEAANRVYSVTTRNTAKSIGSENLTKPDVLAEIARRLADYAVPANEVLYRLSEFARATMADFIDSETGLITVESVMAAINDGKGHLVKKFLVRERKDGKADIILELHDVQDALIALGRYHGLFTDKRVIKMDDQQFDRMQTAKERVRAKIARMMEALRSSDVSDDELREIRDRDNTP